MAKNLRGSDFLRLFMCAFSGIWFAGVAATASAQTAPPSGLVMSSAAANRALSKGEVSLDAAMKIVKACEQFATQHNVLATAYVLDPFGSIVYAHRMDGIRPMESEAALARAKAALFNRGPSGGGGNAATPNIAGQIRVQMRGQQQSPGGLPIIVENEVVGAVGVAGSDTMDEDCARAGLTAVGVAQPVRAPTQNQPAVLR